MVVENSKTSYSSWDSKPVSSSLQRVTIPTTYLRARNLTGLKCFSRWVGSKINKHVIRKHHQFDPISPGS